MNELTEFGQIILVVSTGVLLALFARAFTERLAVPTAALFLITAAALSDLLPELEDELTFIQVERIGVIALMVILFEGGLDIGWRRFRASALPIVSLGVLGTFACAGLIAAAAHLLLDLSWTTSGLLGAALAPTDPAVTFSVLGGRDVRGRTGTILKGESGANDPVGIALMIGMIELATSDDGSFADVLREFTLEMVGGAAIGILGAALLVPLFRFPLPSPALYPLRVLAAAGVVFGAATLVHGSGFLAVFVAGILVGDRALPHREEIEGVLSSLGSLAEIVMFVALGLTVDLTDLFDSGAWLDGLILAVLLGLVFRPIIVVLLLLPVRLSWGERLFVAWSGLKGAVPILLAALAVIAAVDDATEIYHVVFVVVLFSVLVQGTLLPYVAQRLGVPLERID
jgi:potassium/hydrogen antiporter